jgi:hypothetical protein
MTWLLHLGGATVELGPFRSMSSARRHTQEHFFDLNEGWEHLGPAESPRSYLARRGATSSPHQEEAIVDQAASDYLSVTQREITDDNLAGYRLEPNLLRAYSRRGVFVACRRRGSLSELSTSFRPLPGMSCGTLRDIDYVRAAQRKLALRR